MISDTKVVARSFCSDTNVVLCREASLSAVIRKTKKNTNNMKYLQNPGSLLPPTQIIKYLYESKCSAEKKIITKMNTIIITIELAKSTK